MSLTFVVRLYTLYLPIWVALRFLISRERYVHPAHEYTQPLCFAECTCQTIDIIEHRSNLPLDLLHCWGLLVLAIQKSLAYHADPYEMTTGIKPLDPISSATCTKILWPRCCIFFNFVQARSICMDAQTNALMSQQKGYLTTCPAPMGYLKV